MAEIVSWIAVGALVGFASGTLSSARLPGGRLGSAIVGAAGAFVGGGAVALITHRGSVRGVDALTLVAAVVAAAVVVTATKRAQYAEPREPEAYSGR